MTAMRARGVLTGSRSACVFICSSGVVFLHAAACRFGPALPGVQDECLLKLVQKRLPRTYTSIRKPHCDRPSPGRCIVAKVGRRPTLAHRVCEEVKLLRIAVIIC